MRDYAVSNAGTGAQQASPANSRAEQPPLSATLRSTGAEYFAHYIKRPLERILPFVYGAMIISVLIFGFATRNEQYIVPKEGLGYWLGIAGALLMLSLLLYPLRKRFKAWRHIGSVKNWFRLHMMIGIAGPALIIFHSNFHLQSLNATVATIVMLTVVASGLAGRYLYARIHMGLYGRRAEAKELIADIATLKGVLGRDLQNDREFLNKLDGLEMLLPNPEAGPLASIWQLLTIGAKARVASARLQRHAETVFAMESKQQKWSRAKLNSSRALVRQHLALFRAAMVKTARLGVFARMFALWHILHLPLFFLLIVTAIVHVIAVHLY